MTRSRVEIVWETWALMRRMKRTEEERTRVSPITETNVSVEFTEEECLTKSEGEKRGKLEAEVKRLTGNLESEKAKRMKFESDVKLSEQNLEREKMKRVELEDGAKLFEQNLELERSKLLCIICEERVRDTL
ncbi:hypothetical protein R1sor_019406 [Riccia sorocarpa]|uniref:Uncharacterized protein n=1 Tax=Riccia sorocarpa TaxID=122646 RepID=A0ABD3IFR6_9MARC